jgi:hypothetical protein
MAGAELPDVPFLSQKNTSAGCSSFMILNLLGELGRRTQLASLVSACHEGPVRAVNL